MRSPLAYSALPSCSSASGQAAEQRRRAQGRGRRRGRGATNARDERTRDDSETSERRDRAAHGGEDDTARPRARAAACAPRRRSGIGEHHRKPSTHGRVRRQAVWSDDRSVSSEINKRMIRSRENVALILVSISRLLKKAWRGMVQLRVETFALPRTFFPPVSVMHGGASSQLPVAAALHQAEYCAARRAPFPARSRARRILRFVGAARRARGARHSAAAAAPAAALRILGPAAETQPRPVSGTARPTQPRLQHLRGGPNDPRARRRRPAPFVSGDARDT